ncbi:MAG: FG-GAP-like repeat-containing protein [Acidobacteriota bacterium]
MSSSRLSLGRIVGIAVVIALVGAVAVMYYRARQRAGLPEPGTEAYEQTTRQFYRGLAEMQVGLLDVAAQSFTQATTLAPGEPAGWANLGLTELRLGEFDAAAPALERASTLAPRNSAVAFLRARLEATRGQREVAVTQLRRAIELDSGNLFARTALVEEIEAAGGAEADNAAQRLLEELVATQGSNPAVLIERARIAAKRADVSVLRDSMQRLATLSTAWPAEALDQFQAAQQASQGSDMAAASREIAFLRNTLAAVPAFREARARVTASAELIAEPFHTFLRLANSSSAPAPADTALTFSTDDLGAGTPGASRLVATPLDGDTAPIVIGRTDGRVARIDAAGFSTAVPALVGQPSTGPMSAFDWNNDFRTDVLIGTKRGPRLLLQREDGTFADETLRAQGANAPVAGDVTGIWPADIEMDGDLDAIVAVRGAAPFVLRNNGDGTWLRVEPFPGVTDVTSFAWSDVDGDGDPDAVFLDRRGDLHVLANLQAGRFQEVDGPPHHAMIRAFAVGDVNADGVVDVVTLDRGGALRSASVRSSVWTETANGTWADSDDGARLFLADLDNNGAMDLIASSGGESALDLKVQGSTEGPGATVFLAGEDHAWTPLPQHVPAAIEDVADLNGDGVLDLIGVDGGRAVRLTGHGTRGYHYQVIRPRAQAVAGDQRINSFGLGGTIEARSGLLVQKQIIASPLVHVGLGARTIVDVTRIVWPNGVMQADFDLAADRAVVAQQRLKGSCPWIFADNGQALAFVTDFLWRSPLGLRINAQDTAGITQTEDRVKIRGDQLVAREGRYDIRITAELWETHFVDHVSLMAVDHPADVDVFVDERFSRESPNLDVHAVRRPQQPIAHAWDQTGREVTDLVRAPDGRYIDTFDRGRYQGVAADHFVDLDLSAPIPRGRRTWLVAQGWIYPTDSSINVAIGQGHAVVPRGLSLEAQDARGRWVMVAPDLGFPAGKNKTILIDLSRVERAGVPDARRLRLRTNLEVYWDSLATAEDAPAADLRTTRLAPAAATLGYRGYSVTHAAGRTSPELPDYDRIANTVPRWRDLVGFYTRFGDVRALLDGVDDRYVIMNAGDELRLSFGAPPPHADWIRDFVLIGDGWVKDGDYNTTWSKTVGPLPAHGQADYQAGGRAAKLTDDPVYRQHADDWQTFHTRFVSPDTYLDGLR